MRNLKKVLVLVLCLAMMASIMVTGAAAAFTDQKDIDAKHQEAVDACVALNIINGYPDGSFKPNDFITRAEMTKMMCIMLNGGKEPTLGTASTPFTDVPDSHWASAYVKALYNQGVIAGKSADSFDPAGQVTGVEEAKMLLVALGYDQDKANYVGADWQIFVNANASAKGYYDDLQDIDPQQAITREHAAEMIWNALNAYEVEYISVLETDGNGQLTSTSKVQDRVVGSTNDKITMLEDKYEVVTTKGTLEKVDFDSDNQDYDTRVVFNDTVYINGDYYSGYTFDASKDYSDLMRQQVKTMFRFDQKANDFVLLGIYAVNDNKVVSNVLAGDDDKDVMYKAPNEAALHNQTVKFNGTEYKLADDVQVYGPNGARYTGTFPLAKYFSVTLVDKDKANGYESIIVDPFEFAQVTYVSASKLNLSPVSDSIALPHNSYDLAKDDVSLYENAAEDDYAIVRASAYTVSGNDEITKADMVSGTAAATKTDGPIVTDVRVDNTWYALTDAYDVDGDTIRNNDGYDYYYVNGYVFLAEKTKGNISAENIVFIEKTGALTSGLADGVEAKVWFADGTSQIVTLTKIYLPVEKVSDTSYVASTDTNRFNIVNDNAVIDVKHATIDGDLYKQTNYDGKNIAATTVGEYLNDQLYYGENLFTYSRSGSEFTIEALSDQNKGSYDRYYSTLANHIEDGKTNEKDRFSDDAVVFVKDKDGVKVINGKSVNKWDADITRLSGLSDKTSGTQYFKIAAINMVDVAKDSAAVYGFIINKPFTSSEDGDTYYNFTMWDGTKNVDVKVTSPQDPPVKYGFVQFNWSDEADGKADGDDFIVTTVDSSNKLSNATRYDGVPVAVTAFVDKDSVTIWDDTLPNPLPRDLTDDFVVIGVDTDAGEGVPAKMSVAKEDGANIFKNAVVFIVNDGGTDKVEAVFTEVNRALVDSNGVEQFVAKP